MKPLIIPDRKGPWAVRYLSVTHRFDNDSFYNNYFSPTLKEAGMNIRKQTADLKTDWSAHNQIFYDSAADGNLVWRVKVGNKETQSIDYVEVWRSVAVLNQYFGEQTTLPNWTSESRKMFTEQLFESGFIIADLQEFVPISKNQAIEYYRTFVAKWKAKDDCIINTPWNKELNPLDPV
jgi:hypothetical protein